ncbi:hypothetical protein ACQY0O_006613 [Thecaphora frezii]
MDGRRFRRLIKVARARARNAGSLGGFRKRTSRPKFRRDEEGEKGARPGGKRKKAGKIRTKCVLLLLALSALHQPSKRSIVQPNPAQPRCCGQPILASAERRLRPSSRGIQLRSPTRAVPDCRGTTTLRVERPRPTSVAAADRKAKAPGMVVNVANVVNVADGAARAAFLPTRDLCSLKQIDVSSVSGVATLRECIDRLSLAFGINAQDCRHAAPRDIDEASAETEDDGGDEEGDAENSFELRYVRSWLTRLISELSISAGALDEQHQETMDELFERASELLSACAGKMASGPVTRVHRFAKPGLDIDVPLRDATLVHDSLGTHTWGAAPILAQLLLPLPVLSLRRPLEILELGAGTGLVGLAVARWLHRIEPDTEHVVSSTDHHPTVLANLAHNARINGWDGEGKRCNSGTRFEVRKLDWQAVHLSETRDAEDPALSSGAAYVSTAQTVPTLAEQDAEVDWALGIEGGGDGEPRRFDLLIAADCIYDPEHPTWIRSVARRHLRRPDPAGPCRPLLHLMLPLRPTHTKELEAIYAAFPNASAAASCGDAAEAELRILQESDFIGWDNFGAPSLLSSHRRPTHEPRGSANCSTYRWIRIGWD